MAAEREMLEEIFRLQLKALRAGEAQGGATDSFLDIWNRQADPWTILFSTWSNHGI
jgi:hypothetical protein